MIRGKKGISEVVVTVLIVLIAVAAIAIIGAVTYTVTHSASDQASTVVSCNDVQIAPTKCTYSGNAVTILVSRETDDSSINIVKINSVYDTTQGSVIGTEITGANIPPVLETRSFKDVIDNPQRVSLSTVFKDPVGGEKSCALTQKVDCSPASHVDPSACVEAWTCSAWSSCTQGHQTRTCTDANACESSAPATVKECTSNGAGNEEEDNPSPPAAPVISNGKPDSALNAESLAAILEVSTDKNATCRYSLAAGTAYSDMAFNFVSSSNGLYHNVTVYDLIDGNNYTYYVRCSSSGLSNNADYILSFGVENNPLSGYLHFNESISIITDIDNANYLKMDPADELRGAYSISFWVKDLGGGDILGSRTEFSDFSFYTQYYAPWHEGIHSNIGDGTQWLTGRASTNQIPLSSINDGEWHNIIIVANTSVDLSNATETYFDGVAYLATDFMDNHVYDYDGAPLLFNATNPLVIGFNGALGSFSYNGKIDELRIYNKILNASEIAGIVSLKNGAGRPIYNASMAADGLLVYYNFNEVIANPLVANRHDFSSYNAKLFGNVIRKYD